MNKYLYYKANNILKKWRQVLLFGLPILISLAALYISYKSFNLAKTDSINSKKPAWIHNIHILDSTALFQRILFESNKDELVLRDIEVLLPYPLEKVESSHSFNRQWNCVYMQINLLQIFSQYKCPVNQYIPASASSLPTYKLPLAIKFNYIEGTRLKCMYCYYELVFKYFPIGRLKIYSLDYIKELNDKSELEIQEIIDYNNKTQGYYSAEFAQSNEFQEHTIKISDLKYLLDYINSLRTCQFGPYLIQTVNHRTGERKDLIKDTISELSPDVYSPYAITDSNSLIDNMNHIDSIEILLKKNNRYSLLRSKMIELKKWINKDTFCFLYVRDNELQSCIINSIWSSENNYDLWIGLLNEIRIEIWKIDNPGPLI